MNCILLFRNTVVWLLILNIFCFHVTSLCVIGRHLLIVQTTLAVKSEVVVSMAVHRWF